MKADCCVSRARHLMVFHFLRQTMIKGYTQVRSKVIIEWQNVIASLIDKPTSGRRMQLLLSKEQFLVIHSFVAE